MNKVQQYEFIEVVIPQSSTATRFYFPDQPQLRFVSLLNLVCYTPGVVSASILSGNALLTLANLQKTYLVLYYNDKESVNRIPILELNRVATNSTTGEPYSFAITPFAGQQIQWSKSYIQTPSAYSGISSANFSVCLGVYYA
jgi:hypothetical protein